jgi:D-amino-acid dehydrogenase
MPAVATPSVLVLGGGLVGLNTAFALTERGVDVTVVDVAALGSGAARGNAGFICSTLVGPLPGPGVLWPAIKALPDPTSPVRIRPNQLPRLAPWMLRFARACTRERFEGARVALAGLNARTPGLLDRLAAAGAAVQQSDPMAVPFHDEALAARFLADLQPMVDLGAPSPSPMLDGTQLRALVPALTDHVRAGFTLPGDRSIDPGRFVDDLIAVLRARGVRLLEHQRVLSVDHVDGRVRSVATSGGRLEADEVVLAAGAGSQRLGKLFDLRVPVVPGQGYNVTVPATAALTRPVIIEEVHAVATPIAPRIRLGGTMEFAGDPPRFDGRRVDAIIGSLGTFLDLDWSARADTWAGSRPMSADGLPLMGRPRGWSNLVLAAGHGMYGLTLAPTSGEAVAELITEGRSAVDLRPFDPNRFRL